MASFRGLEAGGRRKNPPRSKLVFGEDEGKML